jgi:hypothetical protein
LRLQQRCQSFAAIQVSLAQPQSPRKVYGDADCHKGQMKHKAEEMGPGSASKVRKGCLAANGWRLSPTPVHGIANYGLLTMHADLTGNI